MPTLYLVATPSSLASCLQTAAHADVVLLQGAAAREAAAGPASVLASAAATGVLVCYLVDDLSAGVAVANSEPQKLADGSAASAASVATTLQAVTMAEFVALVLRCHPVVCWR